MSLAAAVILATRGEFLQAGREAAKAAEVHLAMGERPQAFDTLEVAGRFTARGGRHADALAHYDRAFALFDDDLGNVQRPRHVIAYLSRAPRVYSDAALAALGAGEPLRALDYAERGRFRALGFRLGPRGNRPPPAVPRDLWERYLRAWRTAAARAVASTAPIVDVALDELIAQIADHGVPPLSYVPMARPRPAADAVASLAAATPATTVLYSIRENDRLAFLRIDRGGVSPVACAESSCAAILGAVDQHAAALRRGLSLLEMRSAANAMLTAVDPHLGPVLERASAGATRLIWVPHASLVHIPLAACRIGDGFVVDRVAVLHAPSLTAACELLDEHAGSRDAGAVEGRFAGQASTEGAATCLQAIAPGTESSRPSLLADLVDVLGRSAVLHVCCHGSYEFERPLSSSLALWKADPTLEDLYDHAELHPRSLVLMSVCDSATTVQSDVNEPLGFPIALLGLGAQAVIGAACPVEKYAAIAMSLGFMRGLAAGLSSPEALQAAIQWLRALTRSQFADELRLSDHPEQWGYRHYTDRDQPAFPERTDWGHHIHWGGAWRLSAG